MLKREERKGREEEGREESASRVPFFLPSFLPAPLPTFKQQRSGSPVAGGQYVQAQQRASARQYASQALADCS